MSARAGNNRQSGDLPPKRQGRAIRHDVSKPLQNISLSRVVHLLTMFAVLYAAFYAYRIFQWKAEVGGWWNLAMGKRPPQMNVQMGANTGSAPRANSGMKQDVALESHIHGIASILGMQPTDLASALHDVVHQHVAPKSISSLSSSISKTASASGSSAPVASALFDSSRSTADAASKSDGVTDKAGTVAKAVEAIVGFDEPVMAD
ncbi:hypothetical protein ACEPAH_9285 [Sanghuangporus vaninii]